MKPCLAASPRGGVMGSSQDSLGSWDERLQLATAMSEVTEADFSVLHEVHERMLDSQREEVQRRREGLAVSEAAAAVSPATQVTHSPRLRTAVFAMALGLQSQSFKGPVGWQSQSQAVPQPS